MTVDIRELESRVEHVRKESTACSSEGCGFLASEADDLGLEVERAWLEGVISAEMEEVLSEKLREAYRNMSPE